MTPKYKNKKDNKTAIIISNHAAGICNKTIGFTMVIFKYEEDNYDFPFVMGQTEFYDKHYEIIE